MKDNGHEDNHDFEELRRLLMGSELQKLEQLRERLESPETFSSEVGEILPQAMLKSSQHGAELSEAMVPTVEEIVRLSIKKDINKFADALFPVIGPAIRKAIKETIRQMLQSLNRTLEQSLSWQGFKWRLESFRTGIPFAQITLLHGLIYQVEQVFLIHRETGLLLTHLGRDDVNNQNPDLVSSMLSAINDFVGDSFEVEANRTLDSIEVGEISIWIEPGPDAILAVAIRGEAPNSLRTTMQQTLEQVQTELGGVLTDFNGDTLPFEGRQDLLDECMQARYQSGSKGISAKTILIILMLLLLLVYWVASELQRSWQQQEYVDRLGALPGYVITGSMERDGVLVVHGLRDPLSTLPDSIREQSSLVGQVEHRFEPYQSLLPEFVEQRARKILAPPEGVVLKFERSHLVVEGVADLSWRKRLSATLPQITGIESVDDSALKTRFTTAMLQPPPGVSMTLEDGLLYVEGAADQDWINSLAMVRQQHSEISVIDTRALINLTEAALISEIAELEKQTVFFEIETSFDFDSIDAPKLSALTKNIIDLANKLSRNVLIVVRGYSDSAGSFEDNVLLSVERADYVARSLFNAGIEPRYIAIKGLKSPVKAETSDAEKRFNRRVGFEVIVE